MWGWEKEGVKVAKPYGQRVGMDGDGRRAWRWPRDSRIHPGGNS